MAAGNGSEATGAAQAAQLDDPAFLRGIDQAALQAVLEEEITAHLGAARNAFVAVLATRVFVAHAAPAGKTELFCHQLRALGKPLYTLADAHNANLIALGAHPLRPTDLRPLLQPPPTSSP